ncbi:MAG: hypothetical protein ACP5QJ_07520 [Thermosulfidibacteraceae bacterium]
MINIGLDISKDFHEVHILKGQRSISSFRIEVYMMKREEVVE